MGRPENRKIEMICPKCSQVIEVSTTETMVYCIACRKWCREEIDLKRKRLRSTPAEAIRKGIRCH
ncbi:MAG: hypothetical protein IPM66_13575 [Acidobacteriota bacterium]|nr:MAG: hypothetical protein IPM66_13575 [Acidobacteriota bacterium]